MFASGAEEERERQGLFVAVDCLLVCWLVVFFVWCRSEREGFDCLLFVGGLVQISVICVGGEGVFVCACVCCLFFGAEKEREREGLFVLLLVCFFVV